MPASVDHDGLFPVTLRVLPHEPCVGRFDPKMSLSGQSGQAVTASVGHTRTVTRDFKIDTIDAVKAATGRISELARTGELSEPVAHLNRWKVRDVVAHLGGIHRWTARILTERSMAGPGFKKSKLDGPELCDWFDEGAALLLDLFGAADLAEPCPNFNPGSDSTFGWWARRQAHEATVHRWDVEQALRSTTPIPAGTAADGIDEFLDTFIRTRGKQTLASTLVLSTTSPQHVWTLTPSTKPGRIDISTGRPDSEPARTVTEVAGTSESLLLALWGRQSAVEAGLEVVGDSQAAESLIEL